VGRSPSMTTPMSLLHPEGGPRPGTLGPTPGPRPVLVDTPCGCAGTAVPPAISAGDRPPPGAVSPPPTGIPVVVLSAWTRAESLVLKTNPVQYSVAQTGWPRRGFQQAPSVFPAIPHFLTQNGPGSGWISHSGPGASQPFRSLVPAVGSSTPAAARDGAWVCTLAARAGRRPHGCRHNTEVRLCPATLPVTQQGLPRSRLFSALPSSPVLGHSLPELAREQTVSSRPQPGPTPAFQAAGGAMPHPHRGVTSEHGEQESGSEAELHGTPATILLGVCFVLPQFRVCTNVRLLPVSCLPCHRYYGCFQSLLPHVQHLWWEVSRVTSDSALPATRAAGH